VEILGNLWERPGTVFNSQIKPSMPQTKITIHYGEHPIRIYGLPDEPKFNESDISNILPSWTGRLIDDLEIFKIKTDSKMIKALNSAGVYRVLFYLIDNSPTSQEYLRAFEKFFIEEVEPTLRKYGYPIEKSSC
jgi:hypothetical protein